MLGINYVKDFEIDMVHKVGNFGVWASNWGLAICVYNFVLVTFNVVPVGELIRLQLEVDHDNLFFINRNEIY